MTKGEISKVRSAVQMLMADDGDFHGAIEILRNLIGEDHPVARLSRGLKQADFRKIAAGPKQAFRVAMPQTFMVAMPPLCDVCAQGLKMPARYHGLDCLKATPRKRASYPKQEGR